MANGHWTRAACYRVNPHLMTLPAWSAYDITRSALMRLVVQYPTRADGLDFKGGKHIKRTAE